MNKEQIMLQRKLVALCKAADDLSEFHESHAPALDMRQQRALLLALSNLATIALRSATGA